ncbi:ferrous iron transport protein B [Algivirga pacifica]|uniref:Ferrous iron transport protein B n=1 Tax=Algivirga pacifica TaxID=1162670 RepID=A0ABP9DIV7_9BACT
MSKQEVTIGLLGNPNVGKSSIFNQLTGLRQKVGNYAGVTVDKKIGFFSISEDTKAKVIDFPGTYSLYPTSMDERVVLNTFTNPNSPNYPEVVLYVAEAGNLERHLLLLSQIRDLGVKVMLLVTMHDLGHKKGEVYHLNELEKSLEIPVYQVNGRTGEGLDAVKDGLSTMLSQASAPANHQHLYHPNQEVKAITEAIQTDLQVHNAYQALLLAHHYEQLPFLSAAEKERIATISKEHTFQSIKLQVDETMARYNEFTPLVQKAVSKPQEVPGSTTEKIDRILTHPILGPFIFFAILAFVFQAIFTWSEVPMTLIEEAFNGMGELVRSILPAEAWYTSLIADGIIAGLGGVLVFIPQIAILFFLISLLEEVGYMSRAVYLFDSIMQKFGMNGRSIVALISGGACAIPAVMATRTITNWKERLITIMVTPLISCSARIPVYAILIAFAVPSVTVAGFINLQALTFIGLYVLGAVSALIIAFLMKLVFKTQEQSLLMLELPDYKAPHWKNIFTNVYEKVLTFVTEAGQVIIVVSMVLWALASYGPGNSMEQAEQTAVAEAQAQQLDETATADLIAAKQIEVSYAGMIGHAIEPVIQPLGFDWKIGIALISSFAAREVFVGTMATIYSIGSAGEDEDTLRERMDKEVTAEGNKVFTPATSFSLLIFYVFAMQCMATLAVVKRETKSWKWPVIQMAYMGALAYVGSWITYLIMS